MIEKILFYKETPDKFLSKKGAFVNRLNIFPRINEEYVDIKNKKYLDFLECIYSIIFNIFQNYTLCADIFCIDTKTQEDAIKRFFVDNRVEQFKINKAISFKIENIDLLRSFVNNFCPFCDDLFIRVLGPNMDMWEIPLKNSHQEYSKNSSLVHSYICLSVNPIFVEIISQNHLPDDYEKIIKENARHYNLVAEQNEL